MAAVLALAVVVAACDRRELSFDERYEGAQKAVARQAADIDAELAERERQRQEAAAALGTPPVAPSAPAPDTAGNGATP